jgi:hypothetical protein
MVLRFSDFNTGEGRRRVGEILPNSLGGSKGSTDPGVYRELSRVCLTYKVMFLSSLKRHAHSVSESGSISKPTAIAILIATPIMLFVLL